MTSKKQELTPADYEKPYEQNEIALKGIVGFAIGLFLLIVVTFGLMFAFLNALKDVTASDATPANPMRESEKDRLPPEPRLQLAPGFGVDSTSGRVNFELAAPQSEYRELQRQYKETWTKGVKDERTGMFTVLPIEEAKAKLLTQNIKAKTGEPAEAAKMASRKFISDASSGRMASETRR